MIDKQFWNIIVLKGLNIDAYSIIYFLPVIGRKCLVFNEVLHISKSGIYSIVLFAVLNSLQCCL